jgi:hypothetical protein
MNAFTALQQKQMDVIMVAMCPKMDLIAILGTDGSINVFRVISW